MTARAVQVEGIGGGTAVTISGSVTISGTPSVNVAQYGGVAVGAGNAIHVQPGTGAVFVVGGGVAHDAADSGNPNKIGGKVVAQVGTPSFVAVADRVDGFFDGAGRQVVSPPVDWTVTHVPAANTRATASKAAGAAGVKHVLTSIVVSCHNTGAAAAAVLTIEVRDGASGAGTLLWTLKLPILATTLTGSTLILTDLHIVGSAATAMTVEFTAAGGANTNEIVNIAGFDTI